MQCGHARSVSQYTAKRNTLLRAGTPRPSQRVLRWPPSTVVIREVCHGQPRHPRRPRPPLGRSDADDFEAEHQIYREDAVLEYPQSGERIRGRRNIQASRTVQPNKKRFSVRRIVGAGDLWVTEFVLTYDGRPSYTVSIMEFRDGKVMRETQYFGDPFEPGPSRAHLVELMA